jgi:DNA-binding transcriptional MerR regulator
MTESTEKPYRSISEVSDVLGVKAHVLRYWETQFSMLRPRKNRAGARMYRPKDLDQLRRIQHLLHERGYTIAGARRKLLDERRAGASPEPAPRGRRREPQQQMALASGARTLPPRALEEIRRELRALRALVTAPPEGASPKG